MKKLLLSFLLISPLAFSQSYEEAHNKLKERLYMFNGRLMEEPEYHKFIEPYLQEAERSLLIGRYCRENYEKPECKEYVNILISYSCACFHDYARYSSIKEEIQELKIKLLEIIKQIKNEKDLKGLDTQEELQSTCNFLYKANVDYYKKLSLKKKFLLWFYPRGHKLARYLLEKI